MSNLDSKTKLRTWEWPQSAYRDHSLSVFLDDFIPELTKEQAALIELVRNNYKHKDLPKLQLINAVLINAHRYIPKIEKDHNVINKLIRAISLEKYAVKSQKKNKEK